MIPYLVDTNFFIQAHRAIYPLDVVPSFWSKIKELAHSGKIVSIDKVKDEIYSNEDDLKNWCEENLPNNFFLDSSVALTEYRQIASWANSMSHHCRSSALSEFLGSTEADPWLVAFSLKKSIPLITYEKSSPGARRSVKIPDVCIQFGVTYHSPIEMFRLIGESF
ncbi:MAG: DUF4411 family protein [Bacteroidota bacterium]